MIRPLGCRQKRLLVPGIDVQYEYSAHTGTINTQEGEAIIKITRTVQKINLNNTVDISVDINNSTLSLFFEIDGKEFSDTCQNRIVVLALGIGVGPN